MQSMLNRSAARTCRSWINWSLYSALFCAAPPTWGAEELQTLDASNPAIRSGLVQVIARDNDGDARLTGSGFIIGNAGHVLTAMHLVDGEERIEILPLAAPGNPLDGRVIFSNPRADLALLSVAGLPADGLPLALDGFDPGRLVFSAGVWRAGDETWELDATIDDRPADLGNGTVGELSEIAAASGAPAVPLLSHNAMIPAAGYGGPLLNRCSEVVGVNRGTPVSFCGAAAQGRSSRGCCDCGRHNRGGGFDEPRRHRGESRGRVLPQRRRSRTGIGGRG